LGGLIITGPTRTNVNDIRMIAVRGSDQWLT
jgi:glycerate-2-kinase